MFPDARLGARAVRRLEEHIDRAVEFLLGRFEVALLELFLAGLEVAVRGRNQRQDRVFNGCRLSDRG
ncbi:MAG: hypothetical protein AUI64_00430 [Acidobacteria bacterium 13_1_40CM_2_64_6]|nr:MAG: hypothetical protein AUI64_00430 [Acidobacteria bacterium 13_1_40CM_2_64_6]